MNGLQQQPMALRGHYMTARFLSMSQSQERAGWAQVRPDMHEFWPPSAWHGKQSPRQPMAVIRAARPRLPRLARRRLQAAMPV